MFGSFPFFLSSQLSARSSTLQDMDCPHVLHTACGIGPQRRAQDRHASPGIVGHFAKHAMAQTTAALSGNKPVRDGTLSNCPARQTTHCER
jgi:hypothetical protein